MRTTREMMLNGAASLMPSRRQLRLFLIVFLAIMVLGALFAMRANAADPLPCTSDSSCEQTQVMQPGDLIPLADMSEGGSKTLFETFGFADWKIDSELNGTIIDDGLDWTLNALVVFLWFLVLLVVYMTIGIAWWLFSSLDVPGLSDATSDLMTSASGAILSWVFPTAVVVGAIVAYVQGKQAQGSWTGQVAWMVAAGVLAVGLSTDAGVFTRGIDSIRQTGSDMIFSASANAIDGDSDSPIAWDPVDYSVNAPEDKMLRQSGDSIWRVLVATPWCIANFGSIEGCEKYGIQMLEAGTDEEARKAIITDVIYPTEGNNNSEEGKKSPTGAWTKGEQGAQRLGIIAFALLIALVFCALILVLGFSALAGILLTSLLLFVGVFFAALWIIPGKPRQWGVGWAETLLGAVMITFVALLTFGATLALLTALYAATASMGWAISGGISLLLLAVAFGLRRQLADIVSARGSGAGRAFLVGAMMVSKGSKAFTGAPSKMRTSAHNVGRGTRTAFRAARSTGRGAVSAGRFANRAARALPGDVRGAAGHARQQIGYAASAARVGFRDWNNGRAMRPGRPSPSTIRTGGLRPGPASSGRGRTGTSAVSRPAAQKPAANPRSSTQRPATPRTDAQRPNTQRPTTRRNLRRGLEDKRR